MSREIMKRYMADGVYAAFDVDARSIVMTTEDGVRVNDRIFVDDAVLEQLEDYAMEMRIMGHMPRRSRSDLGIAEFLGAVTESTEFVAVLRESLRGYVSEAELRPERTPADVRVEEAAKAAAKALYSFPIKSALAADARDRMDAGQREISEGSEIYARASAALSAAGVPHDVGNADPLEQLAARIRKLAATGRDDLLAALRPSPPLTRVAAIDAIERVLLSYKHLENELTDDNLPCTSDKVAAAVADALGFK